MTVVTEAAPADDRADTPDPVDERIIAVEQGLAFLFNRARSVWIESAKQIHPDLQPAGYKLLSTTARLGQANAHVLAELLAMDKSVVSRQVRQLEEMGLLESRPDERDGRVRVLVATPTAAEALRREGTDSQRRLRAALRKRSPEELQAFAEILNFIAEA